MELFDLYDENRIKTGKTMERGNPEPKGFYRMVVHICIFNDRGKMLIQRRQDNKHGWSGMWDFTVGGSAVAGDTSRQAAAREVREEIGIELADSELRRGLTVQTENVFDDIYIVNRTVDMSEITLQAEEVAEVKWADMETILKMIDEGVFIPYHRALVELLFFMRDHIGARTGEDATSA